MTNYNDLDTPSSAETPPPNGSNNRTFLTLVSILGAIFLLALALMATYLLVIRPRQAAPVTQASQQAKSIELQTSTALVATRDALLLSVTQTPGAIQALTTLTALTPAGQTVVAQGITPSPVFTLIPTEPLPYPPPANQPGSPTQPAGGSTNPTQAGYPATGQTPAAGNQATATPPVVLPSPTATPVMVDARTATVAALLTQAAGNAQPTHVPGTTLTPAIGGAGAPPTPTATALPTTGFAEDAGIPGLMGVAVALLIVMVIARGLRTRTR